MLLTVDVGNTNTVLGVFDETELRVHWRLTFQGSEVDPDRIDGVALASVVPPLTPVLVALARRYLGHEPLVVEPGVKTGMPILYEPPGTWARTGSSTGWRPSPATGGRWWWWTSA